MQRAFLEDRNPFLCFAHIACLVRKLGLADCELRGTFPELFLPLGVTRFLVDEHLLALHGVALTFLRSFEERFHLAFRRLALLPLRTDAPLAPLGLRALGVGLAPPAGLQPLLILERGPAIL